MVKASASINRSLMMKSPEPCPLGRRQCVGGKTTLERMRHASWKRQVSMWSKKLSSAEHRLSTGTCGKTNNGKSSGGEGRIVDAQVSSDRCETMGECSPRLGA